MIAKSTQKLGEKIDDGFSQQAKLIKEEFKEMRKIVTDQFESFAANIIDESKKGRFNDMKIEALSVIDHEEKTYDLVRAYSPKTFTNEIADSLLNLADVRGSNIEAMKLRYFIEQECTQIVGNAWSDPAYNGPTR